MKVLLLFAILPALLAWPAQAANGPASRPFELAPCRLEQRDRLQSFTADCGTLLVPENPARPEGRSLGLFVARIPAVSRRKSADPLFLVAGGPGQSTTDFYASVAPVFTRIGRERDIVLVDQRGTGRSHRLNCTFDETRMLEASRDEIAGQARDCRDALSADAALANYTTSVAVRDLDRVRVALGYERINLYGVSYGTRVAQHYARRFPAATRAVILDGVLAPQTLLGPAMAIDAQAALDRILLRCRQEPACSKSFGDPATDVRSLRDELTRKPRSLHVTDPRTGAPRTLAFTAADLAAVLRLASYNAEQAALLPLALHRARADGDFLALSTQYLLGEGAVDSELAVGMQASVVCTEDLPFVDTARVDAKALAATYLGSSQLEGMQALCSVWPRGFLDADLHEPLRSGAAALLLSGTDDPVTPPAYAALAAQGFRDHTHLVLTGFGHGQLGAPCIDRVMADFLDAGTAVGLDTACTRQLRPMPFFTSLGGPEP